MKLNRRAFIKRAGMLGAAAMAGQRILNSLMAASPPGGQYDIAIVNGKNYFESAIHAVEMLGGIRKFISAGDKVGLLINSDFDEPGAYVNPDISLAALRLISDAGASEITALQTVKEKYWKRSDLYEQYASLLTDLKQVGSNTFPAEFNDEDWVRMESVPGAVSLGEAEVVKKLLECDVFVSIPISKHHATTLLTSALKNTMGVCTRKTNVSCHLGSGVRNDPEYLAQCIADINMIRKVDLCIVDSTRFITTGGPAGPGNINQPDRIVAGSDIVAMDALCSGYLGYAPDEIMTTLKGHESGIGEMHFENMNISETEL